MRSVADYAHPATTAKNTGGISINFYERKQITVYRLRAVDDVWQNIDILRIVPC